MPTAILWFRQDLRLADNPALQAALSFKQIIPLYIFDPGRSPGEASRWWLQQNLAALDKSLRERGSRLFIRRGDSLAILDEVIRASQATHVFWNRLYEPALTERDSWLKTTLRDRGLVCQSFNANLLHEPWQIKNGSEQPYRVFTPYWKNCRQSLHLTQPNAAPGGLGLQADGVQSESLASLELLPCISWYSGFPWRGGEAAAYQKLEEFLQTGLAAYGAERDYPASPGTSQLSPYLALGVIGPRQIAWHVQHYAATHSEDGVLENAEAYIRQLGWRDFSYHLLFHFPQLQRESMNPKFKAFPWREDAAHLQAWQRGETGFPIVDSGMRELWTTGWMHNRVRMLVGSFLTKNLRLSWLAGETWFWDTLVDADLANNIQGWQWIGGCGADAAPYFRIFNPVLQGEKFDPHGEYTRRWLPELKNIGDKFLHKPWEAPVPPHNYPAPVVDLKLSREQALAAYKSLSP
jgi:deoxyribodipyrimidine photo-lyase